MKIAHLVAGAAGLALAGTANAAVISLNFEGISTSYPFSNSSVYIQDFYNGGTSSVGTSGTNYGISFGGNALAICLNTSSANCSNTSRGGLGDPNSQRAGLYFLDGDETFMNVAAGFDTGFSFNYVSASYNGAVTVYDGLNGTGNLLATLNLTVNAGPCDPSQSRIADFCPFSPFGVTFDGIARSVSFAGVANQIVFDDITFGSDVPGQPTVPGGIPEPASWALLIAGFGLVGTAIRRRRPRMAGAVARGRS